MSNLLTFSELLVTKFCHDLSGAIGAINNGFEFLEIENSEEMHKKAMALIKSSSLEASAKLKFYRYIFGRNQSEGEVDLEEMKRLFNEFFAFNKIKLVFVHQSSGPNLVQLSSKTCRLVANLAFLASTSLLQGGEIKIELAQDSVTKKAKKAKKPIAKKVTKTEPAVSNTIHTVTTTTTATTTVKQTNPVVVNEPITPAQPAEKVEIKSTSETTSEPNKSVPAHTDTVIAPQNATQAGVVIAPQNDANQAGVVIAPQEPVQPNPAINTALEGNTILEFNQSDVDLSESHKTALLELTNKVKGQQNFILKLQSYGSVASSDIAEARRLSLQRAIKARKFLIEHEVNPNNISVNAVEDSVNKSNRIEIKIEKNS